MLLFESKSGIIIPENDMPGMIEHTKKGATQHNGDGASAAKLLNRINLLGMPFQLLGIPGKTYIIANLQAVVGMPPGQLIEIMNQNRVPVPTNLPPNPFNGSK